MSRNSAEDTATNPKMSTEIPGTGNSNDKENAREMQETQGRCRDHSELLTLNYARGMRRRERGVKVQGATSCVGHQESKVSW